MNSGAVLHHEIERKLEQARLALGHRETLDIAEALALEVLENVHSPEASKRDAGNILVQFETLKGEPRPDALLEEARDVWAGLGGLDDQRLLKFWQRISSNADVFAAMRSEIERRLRGWILEAIAGLTSREALGEVRDSFGVLDAVVATPLFADHLSMFLRADLEALRVARFENHLARTRPEIESLLELWQGEAARARLEALGEPPSSLPPDCLRELRIRIEEVEGRSRAAADLITRLGLAGRPMQWADLRRHADALSDAREVSETLPGAIRDKVLLAAEAARAGLRRFLETEAHQANNFDDLRELGQNLCKVEAILERVGVILDIGSFDRAIVWIENTWRERLRVIREPAEVEKFGAEVALATTWLPTMLAGLGRRWAARIATIYETWRRIRRGEEFQFLDPKDLPAELEAEQAKQVEILATLEESARLLEMSPATAGSALLIAGSILTDYPGHAEATRLVGNAKHLQITTELDRLLQRLGERDFDLDAYCETASWELAPAAHQALATRRQQLGELNLLLGDPAFGRAEEAEKWWRGFAEAFRILAAQTLPEKFAARLDEVARTRRTEWMMVLDRCLKIEAASGLWKDLARGLDEVAVDRRLDPQLELSRYRSELLRRGELAAAGEMIEMGRFEPAREILLGIEGDPERQRDLEIRLALTEPITDLWSLAKILDQHWARSFYAFPEKALFKLLQGIEQAWLGKDSSSLEIFRAVARRAQRSAAQWSKFAADLADWLAFLDLEDAVSPGLEVHWSLPLLDHLQAQPPERQIERARRLLEKWQLGGANPSVIWLYEVLPAIQPQLFPSGVNPRSLLLDRMSALACRISEWFAMASPEGQDPASWIAAEASRFLEQGRLLEMEHRQVGFLLDETPTRIAAQAAEGSFHRAMHLVENVTAILDYLANLELSDLRAEGDRRSRCRVRLQELPKAPWKEALEARLDRLDPLTRLTFDENRIEEAARRCGDLHELDLIGTFSATADAIQVIVDKLTQAGFADAPVAEAIARDVWRDLPRLAGDLEKSSGVLSLSALVQRMRLLDANEQRFRLAIRQLAESEPVASGSAFEPERHRAYFKLVPVEAPLSSRAFRLVDRYLRFGDRRAFFVQAAEAGLLPPWTSTWLTGESR